MTDQYSQSEVEARHALVFAGQEYAESYRDGVAWGEIEQTERNRIRAAYLSGYRAGTDFEASV